MIVRRLACLILTFLPATALADTFDCVIGPSKSIELAPASGGIVSSIGVKKGDDISDGQVVARLVSDVEEATLAL